MNVLAQSDSSTGENLDEALIAQPNRPTLPIRVPVVAECGASTWPTEVLGSTRSVLLLQSSDPDAALPALSTPVRLRVDWDRQVLNGRIAAHGVAGRFLVSVGERAIRGTRRYPVSLPGTAESAELPQVVEVRITDLSSGGARVEGMSMPIGTDVQLTFTPPGRPAPISVAGFVVRVIEPADVPTLGLAFRLVQQSTDVLGGASA